MKTDQTWWERLLLPRLAKTQWTWKAIFLLSVAVFSFIDSWFIPSSQKLEPGGSGEAALFMIIGWRAVSTSELPISVVVMGTCAAALTSGMNHGFLKSPSLVWTPLGILLTLLVAFWGRGKREQAVSPPPASPDAKSVLNLSNKN